VAAIFAVSRALPAGRVVGDGVDLSGTLWHYWWMAHSLASGQDPRTTDLMYHPIGKDLFAANGSNLVDALASVPFQWVLGPVDYQAWFVVAVLMLNAATFRPLARHVLRSSWGVVAATLAWQLNPFVMFELSDGRLTQAVLPFVPLALLAFIRCMAPQGTRKDAILAGFFTAAQAWIYWFMGWFLAAGFAWLLVHRLWRADDKAAVLRRVGLAGVVCLALVALPALSMAQALEAPGPLNPAPTESPDGRAHVKLTGLAGTLPYLGPGPWMLDMPAYALAIVLWLCTGPKRGRWAGLMGLYTLIAVGPEVRLGNWASVVPNLPYQWAQSYLPFFDRLWFPYRAMSVGMVPAALAVGFMVRRVAERRAVWGGIAAAAWALLAVQGLVQLKLLPLTTKSVAAPETATWMFEQAPGAIIHLPYGLNQRYLTWHLVAPLPHLGGMGESSAIQWPRGFWNRMEGPHLRGLLMAARQPGMPIEWELEYAQKLRSEGFRWVAFHKDRAALEVRGLDDPPGGWSPEAVDRAVAQLVSQVADLLGPPAAVEGNIVSWDLWREALAPHGLEPTDEAITARSWVKEEPPEHVRVLKLDERDQFTRIPGWGHEEKRRVGPRKTMRRGTHGRPRGKVQPSGEP
jgi:hypothetical protein